MGQKTQPTVSKHWRKIGSWGLGFNPISSPHHVTIIGHTCSMYEKNTKYEHRHEESMRRFLDVCVASSNGILSQLCTLYQCNSWWSFNCTFNTKRLQSVYNGLHSVKSRLFRQKVIKIHQLLLHFQTPNIFTIRTRNMDMLACYKCCTTCTLVKVDKYW